MGESQNNDKDKELRLVEQSIVMSNTYRETVDRLCDTIEKIDKSKFRCQLVLGVIFTMFLVFLLLVMTLPIS